MAWAFTIQICINLEPMDSVTLQGLSLWNVREKNNQSVIKVSAEKGEEQDTVNIINYLFLSHDLED